MSNSNKLPRNNRQVTRDFLQRIDLRPAKRMGQSFLCDDNMAAYVARSLRIGERDDVIEVGSGLGGLTRHLLGRGARLTIIEKDKRLAAFLRERFMLERAKILYKQEINLCELDALKYDLRGHFAEHSVKLISNLPYSCASPIIHNFLSQPTPVREAVIMMQKEVALRICSKPGNKIYSSISLGVQIDWHVKLLKIIPSRVFFPAPKVESALLRLTPRLASEVPVCDRRLFRSLVRMGFNQRRKQLKNVLPIKDLRTPWPELCARIGFDERARAESLGLRSWIRMTNFFDSRMDDGLNDKQWESKIADEVLSVVDENDKVAGEATRSEIHERALRHRAVHIFLLNEEGELLLQKRSHLKDSNPEKWDSSASGHVDKGESYAKAAKREIAEELGVSVLKLKMIAKIEASQNTAWEYVELYVGKLRQKVKPDPREISACVFFPMELIKKWIGRKPQDFAEGFLACWSEFCQKLDV